jgi:pimeloyl-ACP methyl ester carboxylesterase
LIWGDHDKIIPVAHGYAAHDAIPGSRLAVLPGLGHFPHVEDPTAVTDIIHEFVSTVPARLPATSRPKVVPPRAI